MAYSKLSESLYRQAIQWARRWTHYAKEALISSPTVPGLTPRKITHIKVSTHVNRKSAQRFALQAVATGRDALAYEYGSGIHSKNGAKMPYVIKPKNAKVLRFVWERLMQEEPVFLSKVEHPGVVAASYGEGYLNASARRLVADAKKELGPLAKKAIMDDFSAIFKKGRAKKR